MNMSITINDIKVKVKLLKSEKILAQATVTLFDVWEEHGWKILRSDRIHPDFQEKIWIQAPSFNTFGSWKEIVFIDDRRLYNQVQEKIYDAYCLAKNKIGEESPFEANEEVNPDDIPF